MKEGPPKKGSSTPSVTPTNGKLLQRKCACGKSAALSGQCKDCHEQKQSLQRYARDRSTLQNVVTSLDQFAGAPPPENHSSGPSPVSIRTNAPLRPQAKLAISGPHDAHEEEADRIAEQVLGSALPNQSNIAEPTAISPLIQRQAAEETPAESTTPTPAVETDSAGTEGGGFIVEDDSMEVGPGQMRKTDFLSQLEAELYDAAEPILASRGRTAQGCPYLNNWIAYGQMRSGSYVETFVRRFASGTEAVASAREYIPLVRERLRQALLVWASTGDITGVPADLAADLPATNEMGAVLSLGNRVAPSNETALADSSGVVQAKHEDGAGSRNPDAQSVQNELGGGRALDSGTRTRMESAFGYNFSTVRIHHDARAANLATRFNARAFTLGHDVAFAGGEYRPGTMIGDALLAHELAHVVQQGAAPAVLAQKPLTNSVSGSLEDDADRSAVGAVVSLWGGAQTKLANLTSNALPRLRSGLRLSRCDSCKSKKEEKQEEELSDGGPAPVAPLPAPGTKECASSLAPDKVIIDHRVTPDPGVIQQPGDQVTFTATFSCLPKGDAFSKFIDPSGAEFGRTVITATGQGRITRKWDGKKQFPQVGTFLVDDGSPYIHRLEPIKYAYKYNSKTKKSEDLMTNESDSPGVRVAARAFTGAGTTHPHFNQANVDALAEIMESELGIGESAEKEAIGWAVRNQMIRMNVADVASARAQFGDATGSTPKATTKTMAEAILRGPMSGDVASGAIKWYSPKGMKELEDAKKKIDCGGGRTKETDIAGKTHDVCSPTWRKSMKQVTIPGARDWFLKAYRL